MLLKRLLLLCLLMSMLPGVLADEAPSRSFEKALAGVEATLHSVPAKARGLLSELEKVELKQNQPLSQLVRYYQLKSRTELLLNAPEEALDAAAAGIALAKSVPSLKAELYLLQLRQQQAYLLKGQEPSVITALETLRGHAKLLNHPALMAEIYLVIGLAYQRIEAFKPALAAMMSALEEAKLSNDALLIKLVAAKLGGLMVELNGFEKATLLLEQSLAYFSDRKMSFNQLLVQLNLAELANKQGNTKEALKLYRQALQLAQILGDGSNRFRINLQIADLSLQSGDTRNMLRHLKATDVLRERESIRYYISKYNYLKANEDLLNERYQQVLDQALPLLLSLQGVSRLYRTEVALYLVASQAHFGLEDYKNAYLTLLDYHQRFSAFSSSEQLDNLERQQMLFNLEILKQENQQLSWSNILQTLELRDKDQQVDSLNIMVLLGTGIALLASLAAFWLNRRRKWWGQVANTDSLTGLYNRRYLRSRMDELHHDMAAGTYPVSSILLDIDLFKKVNDSYGHPVGDRVLTGVSELLKNNIRHDDICSRVGGEEFMLLLPNTNLEQAVGVAEEFRERIAQEKFKSDQGETFHITASFGVIAVESNQSLADIYNAVDKLLYRAKRHGRNRVESGVHPSRDDAATGTRAEVTPIVIKLQHLARLVRRLKFRVAQHFS